MARVKLSCIMGCPGLKISYREIGLLGLSQISLSPVPVKLKKVTSSLHQTDKTIAIQGW